MSSRMLLAGVSVMACLGLSGCTGKQILAMRHRPEQPAAAPSGGAAAPAPPFTGPAIAATTDYPKNENAPRPQPPAAFAPLKNPLSATPDVLAKGKDIFMADCAICHGAAGMGNGPGGASLTPKPANFTTPIHGALPDGYWFWRVSEGGQVPPFSASGSAMPPWKTALNEQQRWLVILYEHTFHK